MTQPILFSLVASLCVVPAAYGAVRGKLTPGSGFWGLIGLALIGPLVWLTIRSGGAWQTDFATALWITVAATLISFVAMAILAREGWRLAAVVMPYMAILGISAFLWESTGNQDSLAITSNWIVFHILVSVLTYAVVTLAASAACAGILQERALKHKQPTNFTRQLPSVSDCNEFQFKLLALGELILGVGLLTGIAASLSQGGPVFQFDHKSTFAVAAFVVIGALLVAQPKSGVRGHQVMRVILSAYLLLTLAYPGVKFVTSILL
jgi:ABC-type uncharacterized transport system permease subunit